MRIISALMAASLLAAGSASAQTVYTGLTVFPGGMVGGPALTARNSFLLSLGAGSVSSGFDGLPLGTMGPLALNIGSGTTATLAGSGVVRQGALAGRFATSGTRYWEQMVGPGSAFNITFSQAVASFGFFGTDIGDFNGRLTLNFLLGANPIGSFLVQEGNLSGTARPTLEGNLRFWGVTYSANAFDQIEFVLEGDSDIFGFDDMTVAQLSSVPEVEVAEPTGLTLLGSGLLALMGAWRRRRR